jgi:nicotinic acid mononucleotide adenylyltransferase
MRIEDAKLILIDILNYQIADSIISQYEAKDKESSKVITFQKNAIDKLYRQLANDELRIAALERVIKNKDEEITFKDDVIKKQKREIRKQKTLKILGFSGAIILPVVTALLLLN